MTQYIIDYDKTMYKDYIKKVLTSNKLAFIAYDSLNRIKVPMAFNLGRLALVNAALLTVKAMVPLVNIKKIG